MKQDKIFAHMYLMILSWDNESGCRWLLAECGSLCSMLDDRGGPPSISIVASESSEEDVLIVSHPS